MVLTVEAPNKIPKTILEKTTSLFLGGSIEMGKAEEWQVRLIKDLGDYNDNLLLMNPRRKDWDSSWVQDPTPGTKFHEQVTWELDMQNAATYCVYYFAADTMSPITLLELGLHLHDKKKIFVYANESYPRYGNVKIVCDANGIEVYESYKEMLDAIKKELPNK